MRKIACIMVLLLFSSVSTAQKWDIITVESDHTKLDIHWECRGAIPNRCFIKLDDETVQEKDFDHTQPDRIPTQILFLIDTSVPMKSAVKQGINPVLRDILHQPPPNRQFALATFDTGLSIHQRFGCSPEDITTSLDNIRVIGQETALYRLALQAMDIFPEDAQAHRILVLFSDGMAEDSQYRAKDVSAKANRERITIICASYKTELPSQNSDLILDQGMQLMADSSGGKFWRANTEHRLDDSFVSNLHQFPNYSGVMEIQSSDITPRRYGMQIVVVGVDLSDGQILSSEVNWDLGQKPFPWFLITMITFLTVGCAIVIWIIIKRPQRKQLPPPTPQPQQPTTKKMPKTMVSSPLPPKLVLARLIGNNEELLIREQNCRIGGTPTDNDVVIGYIHPADDFYSAGK